MRILLFYQYYHNPDCSAAGRHFQFAKALGREHHVDIVASDMWEHKRQTRLFEWTPPGVTLHSFPADYENAMSIRKRLSSYSKYTLGAIRRGMSVSRPDVIIGSSTPLTAAWAAAKVARLRGTPWIFEVRDLWPDFPFQMGAFPNPWMRKRLYGLEKRLYQSAAHIITLSTDMEAHVLRQNVPSSSVSTLMNGTDLDLNDRITPEEVDSLREEHNLQGKKVVLYAGTFGRANALPLLIETARGMAHRSDIHFAFLGEGYHAPLLQDAMRDLPNVGVYPPEPRHLIFRWFRLASLSLVSFIDLPVLAANSPAKFFDSLAAGTPVLVTNPGWTKSFVEKYECGWYAPAHEPDDMIRGIERAFSDPEAYHRASTNGQDVARRLFDRTRMAEKLETILEQVVNGQSSMVNSQRSTVND